jgi:hypothetical protein
MSSLFFDYPVSGINESDLSSPSFSILLSPQNDPTVQINAASGEDDAPLLIGRLIRIFRSNERLFAELRTLSQRLRSSRAYLAEPGCNLSLGTAYYDYWRAKHSGVLTFLRANRLEARRLLAQINRDTLSHSEIFTQYLISQSFLSISSTDSRLSCPRRSGR